MNRHTQEHTHTHMHKHSLFLIFLTDIHTELVQAALAKHKEEKMGLPMPTKRRSAFVQSPVENCTPPGTPHWVFKCMNVSPILMSENNVDICMLPGDITIHFSVEAVV